MRELGAVEAALDLGCGDGRLATELRARELTVADVSTVALERARPRCPTPATSSSTPTRRSRFDDSCFDLVLCTETIEHVRDVQLFLSEIRRVLRPGGELALTHSGDRPARPPEDPLSPHLHRFTRRSLARLLDELGFELSSLRRRSGTLLARARRP